MHSVPHANTQTGSTEPDTHDIADSWSLRKRCAFRFAFCYFSLSAIFVTGVLTVLPFFGDSLQEAVDKLRFVPVQWLALHLFGIVGIAGHPHSADSRDTALDWISLALLTTVAIFGMLVWSFLDGRRVNHKRLATALHLLLRFLLIFLLFRYGLMKVFPLQMDPPSLAALNEPLGSTSPLMLLWTLIGLHPAYEMLCGIIELTAAILLCFRRTSTVGALLATFVMTNVLLFNLFFDVPVKLGAANLLLLSLATLTPDVTSLYRFFWQHKATTLAMADRPGRRSTPHGYSQGAWQAGFVLLVLLRFLPPFAQAGFQTRASLQHPSPLSGEWRVDEATLVTNGQSLNMPVLTAEGRPLQALFLEPNGSVMARSSDGQLWRAAATIDLTRKTFALFSGYFDGERFNTDYTFEQPDEDHLVLHPTEESAHTHGTLKLSRVPLPQHYALLDRGFHWINEWGYRR